MINETCSTLSFYWSSLEIIRKQLIKLRDISFSKTIYLWNLYWKKGWTEEQT